ncbi:SMI1/KNR4 family protein [Paenibacillus profundus]|uniref:SMI1/KNR4 family protein n=1 Tax=Paenibacillus profundus TaxID=1173085 RepID=A0ABS8YRA8_9BACL|nr:SMI1/KNR4 family protein [Paenibacillus profundus]MCE5173140.1 SMI1/KNR4 family protein [Paenibacillus profundus]
MNKNIEWKSDYCPADINMIKAVEKNIGIVFPDDFLHIAKEYHGGEPSSKTIIVNNKKIIFGYLLTFLAFDELDILDKYNSEKDNLPPNYFPFAIDEEGNMFCFDYNDNVPPRIVFVEKKNDGSISSLIIAQNFLDFIQLMN